MLNDRDRVTGCADHVMSFLPPGGLVLCGEGTIDVGMMTTIGHDCLELQN